MRTLITVALAALCVANVFAQTAPTSAPTQRRAIVIPLPSNPVPVAETQLQEAIPEVPQNEVTLPAIPEGLETAKFRIPSNTINGWYMRGDAEGEAQNLEYFLQALIWGSSIADQQAAQDSGKLIEVDFNLLEVLVIESTENINRIGNTIDPGLEPYLRELALRGHSGEQVASGISVLPADMTTGLIRTGPTRAELEAQQSASRRASGGGTGWTRHTLRYEGSASRGDLRITLIDIFEDREDNRRVTALILLESPEMEDEIEIQERRRVVFDNWTIRFEESDTEGSDSEDWTATFEIKEN